MESYSEKTIDTYNICLKKLNMLDIDYKSFDDPNILHTQISNISSRKGGKLSNSAVKTYLCAILWYHTQHNTLNHNIHKLKNIISTIKQEYVNIYDQNILSEREKDVFLEWEQIVDVYKLLYTDRLKNFKSFTNCVIIGLYVLFPPRRLRDYTNMFITHNSDNLDDTYNYFIIDSKQFLFNDFKTKKTCEHLFDIPKSLFDLLNEYINTYKLHNHSLLNTDENKLSAKIKRIMFKYTNKNASVNTFRHSYITYCNQNGLINSTQLKKILASKMGHSHITQQDIYAKINIHSNDESIHDE
jgi:hypothetical protein